MLYLITIPYFIHPTPGSFTQDLFVESKHSPTQLQLLKLLVDLKIKYPEQIKWIKCFDTINAIRPEIFPVYSDEPVQCLVHVGSERAPFIIQPVEILNV